MIRFFFALSTLLLSQASAKVVNGTHAPDDLTQQQGRASGPGDKISAATVGLGAASPECSGIVIEGCVVTRPECIRETASDTFVFTGEHPTKKSRIAETRTLTGVEHFPIAVARPEEMLPESISMSDSVLTPLERISEKDEVPAFVIGYGNEGEAKRTATQGHLYSGLGSSDMYQFKPVGKDGSLRNPNARLATADRGSALGTYRSVGEDQQALEISGLMGEARGADALRAFGFREFDIKWIRRSLKELGCKATAGKKPGRNAGIDELVKHLKVFNRFSPSKATSERLDETLPASDKKKLAGALATVLNLDKHTAFDFEAMRPSERRVKALPPEALKGSDQFVVFKVTVDRPEKTQDVYQVTVSSAGWSDIQPLEETKPDKR